MQLELFQKSAVSVKTLGKSPPTLARVERATRVEEEWAKALGTPVLLSTN